MPTQNNITPPIIIMIPIFNDWASANILIPLLDEALGDIHHPLQIILVDDGSSLSAQQHFNLPQPLKHVQQINILELACNLGHQRAIAVALAYIEENIGCRSVVIMDGDGEDDPNDVPKLIQQCEQHGNQKIIFSKRTQRSESVWFQIFYAMYRLLYRFLTGSSIQMGNFSIIPHPILKRLVVVSEIWNHYTAGVLKARLPYLELNTKRNPRLQGQSKMNFTALVIHGLSAISVHGDVIGVRILIATAFLMVFSSLLTVIIFVIKIFTDLAIPGWTSTLTSSLLIIFMQAIMISVYFVFSVLTNRNHNTFIPRRDYQHFIISCKPMVE